MKTKYFFGMLLSGALLAACTAEDDLNPAKVAEVNSSAPVFTVHLDPQNRATWDQQSNGAYKVGFEPGDLLSLFFGSPSATSFTDYDNAIYEGKADGEEGGLTLTTKSMVKDGYAVLVYPADTTFANKGNEDPVITIKPVQDKTTKKLTPYMSEILTIDPYPTEDDDDEPSVNSSQAGYGRNYDVFLKRVGSTLELGTTLEKTPNIPSSVSPLEVTSIVLKPGVAGKFTTGVKVIGWDHSTGFGKEGRPTGQDWDTSKNKAKAHPSWNNISDLDFANPVTTADSLTTSDVEGGVAIFTLLPCAADYAGSDNDSIVVYTNYGRAAVKSSTTKIWKNNQGTEMILKDGFKELLNNGKSLWDKASSGTFKNENIGYYVKKSVKLDMSSFTMDRLHIKDADHLKEALVVYQTLYSSKDVTFILDGDEDGMFVMDQPAWSALAAQQAKSGNKLKVAPCNMENVCIAVVLESGDSEQEVPALAFETPKDDNGDEGDDLEYVILDGAWKYTSTEDLSKAKKLTGFNHLVVAEGSTFAPKSFITATGTFDITIEKGATVNVAEGVTADLISKTLYNQGEITIEKGGLLRTRDNATIENCALKQNANGTITGLTAGAGTIYNYGELGIVQNTTGVINNYGVIEIKNETAATLVTNNAANSTKISDPFSATNKIGSIILSNAQGNNLTTVKNANTNKGFLKLKINKSNPTKEDIGIANYLILQNGCTALRASHSGSNGSTVTDIETTVKCFESESNNVQLTGTFNLDALIVTKGTVQILNTATLNINANGQLYVKGKITQAGTLTYNGTELGNTATDKAHFAGYFGGDKDNDWKNVTVNK